MNIIFSISDIPENSVLAIYGSGETGCNLFQKLQTLRKDVEVRYFLDSNKTGTFYDRPLLQYDSCNMLLDKLVIVIASVFWDDIIKNLSAIHEDECLVVGNELLYELSQLTGGGAFVYEEEEFAEKSHLHAYVVDLFSSPDDQDLYKTCLGLRDPDRLKRHQATLRMPALRSRQTPYLELNLPPKNVLLS